MSLLGQGWQDTAIVSWPGRRPWQAPTASWSILIPVHAWWKCQRMWRRDKSTRLGLGSLKYLFYFFPHRHQTKQRLEKCSLHSKTSLQTGKPHWKMSAGFKRSLENASPCEQDASNWNGEEQKCSSNRLLWTWEMPPPTSGQVTKHSPAP